MRSCAAHARQGFEGQPADGRIVLSRQDSQSENRRIVLRGASLLANRSDHLDCSCRIGNSTFHYDVGVSGRQVSFADVVGAALGTEDQEPLQTMPAIQHVAVPTSIVLSLILAWDRTALRSNSGRNVLSEVSHCHLQKVRRGLPVERGLNENPQASAQNRKDCWAS